MLQQTQTERVIPYFNRWISLWPTPESLAQASFEEALREWSGLGYNRRCKYLKECASIITNDYQGVVPSCLEQLQLLPGVGSYTAGAVTVFAYNYPALIIETNIRAALLHTFFSNRDAVSDTELCPILEASLDRDNPRHWYWSLMDYGVLLKKQMTNPNRQSKQYTRQSSFHGSFRQVRGAVIKALVSGGPATLDELKIRTGMDQSRIEEALKILSAEHFVAEKEHIYHID
jgi:A/G-specific adenine glycosylase